MQIITVLMLQIWYNKIMQHKIMELNFFKYFYFLKKFYFLLK